MEDVDGVRVAPRGGVLLAARVACRGQQTIFAKLVIVLNDVLDL